jgi:hypothetical protein
MWIRGRESREAVHLSLTVVPASVIQLPMSRRAGYGVQAAMPRRTKSPGGTGSTVRRAFGAPYAFAARVPAWLALDLHVR